MKNPMAVNIADNRNLGMEMGEDIKFSTSYDGSCYQASTGASDSLDGRSCTRLAGHSGLHMQNRGAWGTSPVVTFYWVRSD